MDSKFFRPMQRELLTGVLSKSAFCRLNKILLKNLLKSLIANRQSFSEHIAQRMHGHQVPLKDLEVNECRANRTKYESKFLNQLESHFGTILYLHNIAHHSRYTRKDSHPKITNNLCAFEVRLYAYRSEGFQSSDEISMITCYFKIWQ